MHEYSVTFTVPPQWQLILELQAKAEGISVEQKIEEFLKQKIGTTRAQVSRQLIPNVTKPSQTNAEEISQEQITDDAIFLKLQERNIRLIFCGPGDYKVRANRKKILRAIRKNPIMQDNQLSIEQRLESSLNQIFPASGVFWIGKLHTSEIKERLNQRGVSLPAPEKQVNTLIYLIAKALEDLRTNDLIVNAQELDQAIDVSIIPQIPFQWNHWRDVRIEQIFLRLQEKGYEISCSDSAKEVLRMRFRGHLQRKFQDREISLEQFDSMLEEVIQRPLPGFYWTHVELPGMRWSSLKSITIDDVQRRMEMVNVPNFPKCDSEFLLVCVRKIVKKILEARHINEKDIDHALTLIAERPELIETNVSSGRAAPYTIPQSGGLTWRQRVKKGLTGGG